MTRSCITYPKPRISWNWGIFGKYILPIIRKSEGCNTPKNCTRSHYQAIRALSQFSPLLTHSDPVIQTLRNMLSFCPFNLQPRHAIIHVCHFFATYIVLLSSTNFPPYFFVVFHYFFQCLPIYPLWVHSLLEGNAVAIISLRHDKNIVPRLSKVKMTYSYFFLV